MGMSYFSPIYARLPQILTINQTIGTIQTSLRLNFFLYGPLIREMTFLQRLCGFIYAISSFSTIFVTLSLLVMPIGVISGYRIIAFADYTQLRWLIRAFFLVLFFNRVNEWTMSLPAGYRLGRRDSNAILWMAPCKLTHPPFLLRKPVLSPITFTLIPCQLTCSTK